MIVFVLVLALAGEAEFYQATALERDGHYAEAVELLAKISDGPFADDALQEIAQIYEEKLADPVRAAASYERLVKEFPDSRLAERARRRAAALHQAMGPGDGAAEAVAELNDILLGAPARPRPESIARMEKLIARWPDFPDAPRALTWLATAELEAGDRAAARARLAEVVARFPGGEWAARAQRSIGDLLVEDGDLAAAERAYRTLATLDHDAGQLAFARLARARWRARGLAASWIVLAAALLAAIALVRRDAGSFAPLRRAPAEALYFIPVAALFAGAALTEHAAMMRAVAIICAGGLVIAWLSGATLGAARRLPAWRVAAHCAAVLACVLAVCYIAIIHERLVDFLLETLKYGPER